MSLCMNKADWETALGIKTLLELKNDFPLEIKFDKKEQVNRVVIPNTVNLRSYVDRAIDFFRREHNITMELQPIIKR